MDDKTEKLPVEEIFRLLEESNGSKAFYIYSATEAELNKWFALLPFQFRESDGVKWFKFWEIGKLKITLFPSPEVDLRKFKYVHPS